jgi:eukaryotic-like serine/threonine-protein kinase
MSKHRVPIHDSDFHDSRLDVMDAERWRQVDDLLGASLDLEPEARPGFLAERCRGDDQLRREVEALLAAHERAATFIETPAMKVAARGVAADTARAGVAREVGPYRILSLLGSGGMGEVYLAEDPRLGRRVALKFLPLPFVIDPDRVRRFETEARAASALNHPNILTVFDIGQADGTHYIVTEYVEGETLRARLDSGPLPALEAVRVAAQVAEALAAAHAAGITHRDIKPDNIVLRRDGYVKVLDFGLAKLSEAPGIDSTEHALRTPPGIILGTIKYMSPEQALGIEVDGRSDLWGLGSVLYEMVTGRAPFEGRKAAVLDAILHQAPPPVADFAEALPPLLDAVVGRALEKDPELRYQTASDLCADLRRLRRELEPFGSRWGRAVTRLQRGRARGWRARAALAACAAVVLALGAWFFLAPRGRPRPSPPAGPNWAGAKSLQLTSDAGLEYSPSLAPDAKALVYASRAAGNWDIYWQRVGGKNTVNLTKDSAADDMQPAFSPDGNHLAFRSERAPAGVYVMEATSENPRRVADFGYYPAWSPDGKSLVIGEDTFVEPTSRALFPSALWIIEVATGAKRRLTEGDAVQPSWSPGGHRVAYWGTRPGGAQRDIWTIPAGGGAPVQVTDDEAFDWNPVWSPDGRHLYFASYRGGSMNFWRVPLDERTGEVLGAPETVTTPSSYSQHLSFSRDGTRMAYVQKSETENLHRVAFDPAALKALGAPEAVTRGSVRIVSPDPSPDGEWVAYSSQGEPQEDIHLLRRDGTGHRQLTDDHFADRFPRWSPDGRRLSFYSDRSGRYEVWVVNADGTGLAQLTSTTGPIAIYPVWSPDGRRLVYDQRDNATFLIEADTPSQGQTPRQLPPLPRPGEHFRAWSWSADGRKLAGWGIHRADSKGSIYVYDFDTQSYEQLAAFGDRPVWLRAGGRLLFHNAGRIHSFDAATKRVREVFSAAPHLAQSASLTRDERTLYFTLLRSEANVWLLSLE